MYSAEGLKQALLKPVPRTFIIPSQKEAEDYVPQSGPWEKEKYQTWEPGTPSKYGLSMTTMLLT
jgi:hypothetical protein